MSTIRKTPPIERSNDFMHLRHRMTRRNISRRAIEVVLFTILAVVVFLAIAPFLWTIAISVRSREMIFQRSLNLFAPIVLNNYRTMLSSSTFLSALFNTAIIATVSTVITMLLAAPAGYAMGRFNVGGKSLLLTVLSLRFFPVAIVIVPSYVFFSNVRMVDRLPALVIMMIFISLPLAIWIIRSFVVQIPAAYEESALTDGCTKLGALFRITIPMCSQGMVVAAIFPFVYAWNEFLIPLVLTRFRWTTLTVYSSIFITDHRVDWGSIMAVVTIMLIPIAIGVVIVRRYLMRGFAGGLK